MIEIKHAIILFIQTVVERGSHVVAWSVAINLFATALVFTVYTDTPVTLERGDRSHCVQ